MAKPKLLDLFCGAGGASMGYHLAGFEVTGVDLAPQRRYPFTFHQADALTCTLDGYDAIHASPPCQLFSPATRPERRARHVNLIPVMRARLLEVGVPWVIENVPQAPLRTVLVLCGLMFDLPIFRHRCFEASQLLWSSEHPSHAGKHIGEGYYSIAGRAGRWKSWGTAKRNVMKGTVKEWRHAMGIHWMTRDELTQAIPPAYTRFIGMQLLTALGQTIRGPVG